LGKESVESETSADICRRLPKIEKGVDDYAARLDDVKEAVVSAAHD